VEDGLVNGHTCWLLAMFLGANIFIGSWLGCWWPVGILYSLSEELLQAIGHKEGFHLT